MDQNHLGDTVICCGHSAGMVHVTRALLHLVDNCAHYDAT